MKYVMPTKPLHSEFIVEINKLGQVTHVRAGKPSKNLIFNSQTYTNALMSYIRTPDGMHAVPGTYRLNYDYNPKSHMIRRTVDIVKRGGVDANALGAVIVMQQTAAKREAQARAAHPAAQHTPSLPNLNAIGIPSSAPHR